MKRQTPGHRPKDFVDPRFFRDVSSGLLVFEAGKRAPRGPFSGLQDGPHIGSCPGRPPMAVSCRILQCFLLADVVSYRIFECFGPLGPPNSSLKSDSIVNCDTLCTSISLCIVICGLPLFPRVACKGVVLDDVSLVCVSVCLPDFVCLFSVWCLLYAVCRVMSYNVM